jgi:hypothetical protein
VLQPPKEYKPINPPRCHPRRWAGNEWRPRSNLERKAGSARWSCYTRSSGSPPILWTQSNRGRSGPSLRGRSAEIRHGVVQKLRAATHGTSIGGGGWRAQRQPRSPASKIDKLVYALMPRLFGVTELLTTTGRLFRPESCNEQTAILYLCTVATDQWLPSPRPSGSHRSTHWPWPLLSPGPIAFQVFRNKQSPRFNSFFTG